MSRHGTVTYNPQKKVFKNKACTRGLHTEVLYNLGPTKNIGTSLKTFGLTGNETEVLAVILEGDRDKVASQIRGDKQDLSKLSDLTDLQQIIKLHKLNSVKADELDRIKDIVLSRVAAKDIL